MKKNYLLLVRFISFYIMMDCSMLVFAIAKIDQISFTVMDNGLIIMQHTIHLPFC